jgi:uncharacterized protein
MRSPRAVGDGLFTSTEAGPRLLGSRCTACGAHTFPVQDGCARCTAASMEAVQLEPRGTLWTWTIQGFPPKAPPYLGDADASTFEPFGVGYIELPGQVKVEARLTVSDPASLRIGMAMELVLVPLGVTDDGQIIETFAFAPVAAS